jgi:mannan endo-1,4-beta-mannosidase
MGKRPALIFVFIISMFLRALGQPVKPSDTLLTAETRALFNNLHSLAGQGVLLGHHDATAYGVNWRLVKDSADVKSVTGSYPAIYGWDLSGIEVDSTYDINGIPFETQRRLAREAYQRGGINTFSWHMHNPFNGKTSWDTAATAISQLLPGGVLHQTYLSYLNKAAAYLSTLKGRYGEPVPILFRPFHEMTGEWFWWGVSTTTSEEFRQLWQFTVNYLRQTKQLHNLVMVYSAANYYDELELTEQYPGDDYVDMIGFDRYCTDTTDTYIKGMQRQLQILQQVGTQRHKLTCIAETGYQGVPQANWWTKTLQPLLAEYNQVSYLMIWRNHGPDHYFAPYPGQLSANDFKSFTSQNSIILQNRLTLMGIYGVNHQMRYNWHISPP